MRERLDGGFVTDARRNHVAVFRARRWRDHHEIAIEHTAPSHAIAFDLHEKRVFGWDEAAIDCDEVLAMLGKQRRLARVDLAVVRNRLGVTGCGKTKETHAARARLVALDITFALQRV